MFLKVCWIPSLVVAFAMIPKAMGDTKAQRKPWEFGRFLKTASYFDAFKPKFKIPFLSSTKASKVVQPNDVLWSSTESKGKFQNDFAWGPLDDVVMGGVSKTDLNPGQAFEGKWTGFTSSLNNGGFAGIRTKLFDPPLDLSACKGLRIRFVGDGQRFKFIVRDDDDWNGIAWSSSFDTEKNKLVDVKVPFEKFTPTRFARRLPSLTPFNKKTLRGIQLTLSKFEYEGDLNPKFKEGPFSVVVDSIIAF
mmetsp:Transcript_16555/g.22790  ORF Transcript_16555/g.22790 Transcript_16555/m.22790 type:complete len:248 (+) Transcript_16555:3-746(+)